jgi:hypothetical protein
MPNRTLLALVLLVILVFGCAKRVPEPASVAPGTPHVTWVLMYGDRENPDAEFACQSDSTAECMIPVSQSNSQTFSDVHFYFHGAGKETKYEGTTSIGYLQGAPDTHTTRTNITVKKNESITNSSTTGIVTSTPGTYTVMLDMAATVTDTGRQQPVRESFQVRVQ